MTAIDDLIEEVRRAKMLSPDEARRVRESAGLSCARLAKALGVPASTLARWESGERTPPPRRDAPLE